MTNTFDAIVVGARCAGSPAAMLLARRGHRVLLLDRATFPSDTLSTHVVQPVAVAAMKRWGLLERLVATGCPPIHTFSFDFGPLQLSGAPGTSESPVAFCARRTVLDKLLRDAAEEAGAQVREDFSVEDLLIEDGRVVGIRGRSKRSGAMSEERAAIVIGADGRASVVADRIRPEKYNERPALLQPYYSYWSGLPMEGRFETYIRPVRGFAAAPTHDGLTVVVGGWPVAEYEANKQDVDRHFDALLQLAPAFYERTRRAKRETRWVGTATPNYFRKPYGAGWALIGDAGYLKDPITAQGILDAFVDGERCAAAAHDALTGAAPLEVSMAAYQGDRDRRAQPMYDFTCQLASLEPPPPELQQLFGAIAGNQAAMDRFVQMNAGTLSPAEFFAPESMAAMTGVKAAA